MEIGAKKEDGRAKVTAVMDRYFHVEQESMVQGETVLEVCRTHSDQPALFSVQNRRSGTSKTGG